MQKRSYGWKPDLPDGRDHLYALVSPGAPVNTVQLADKFKLPPVVDQGQLGSCTANSIAGIIGFDLLNKHVKNNVAWFQPSRLFIYYNERAMEGTISKDSGAQIRDGIKTIGVNGAAHEALWPYTTSKFRVKPYAKAYTDALQFKAVKYTRIDIPTRGSLVAVLNSGLPFVYGFSVYSSFETSIVAKTGVVPMPNLSKESLLGGHAVFGHGYDAPSDRFKTRNSWGTGWGHEGDFTIPADYLINSNYASDFWTIETIL